MEEFCGTVSLNVQTVLLKLTHTRLQVTQLRVQPSQACNAAIRSHSLSVLLFIKFHSEASFGSVRVLWSVRRGSVS